MERGIAITRGRTMGVRGNPRTLGVKAQIVPGPEASGQVANNILELIHGDHLDEILVLRMGRRIHSVIRHPDNRLLDIGR
jgi:hypothetical protein